MSVSEVVAYFLTLSAIMLAPGPVVLVLIVKAASKDIFGAIGFGLGFAIGAAIIVSVVSFGLGAWLTTVPEFFEYSKFIMMAYILWLAIGVWKGDFSIEGKCAHQHRPFYSLGAGILTCFISPYMMILFPLVLTSSMGTTVIEPSRFFMFVVITFATGITSSVLVISLASQISRLVRSPRSTIFLNRGLASMLVFGGGWMAFF